MAPHDRSPEDQRLAALLQALPAPPAPAGLEGRVRQLRRKRQRLQIAGGAAAAATVIGLGTLAFWPAPPTAAPVAVTPPAPVLRDAARDLAVLTAQPPVVAVAPGQAEWLTVLHEICEGQPK